MLVSISFKLSRDHVPLFESIIPKRYTLTNRGLKIFNPCTGFSYPSYRELYDTGTNQTKINWKQRRVRSGVHGLLTYKLSEQIIKIIFTQINDFSFFEHNSQVRVFISFMLVNDRSHVYPQLINYMCWHLFLRLINCCVWFWSYVFLCISLK